MVDKEYKENMKNEGDKLGAAKLSDEVLEDVNGGLGAALIGPRTSESQEP